MHIETKPIGKQIAQLQQFFPALTSVDNTGLVQRIVDGEASTRFQLGFMWYAVPNWLKNPSTFSNTYGEAVAKVVDLIRGERKTKFHTCHDGPIDCQRLIWTRDGETYFKRLAKQQGDPDIFLVPCRLDTRHDERVREWEVCVLNYGERLTAIGMFAISSIVLAHLEAFGDFDSMSIDCNLDGFYNPRPGNPVYSSELGASNQYFPFDDGRLKFSMWLPNASK